MGPTSRTTARSTGCGQRAGRDRQSRIAAGALPAAAQVLYGTVVGNVQDPSGAVVAGATVTVTSKETGQVREAVTSEAGDYSIPNLLPGIYDVKVTRQGFTTFTKTNVNITANNVTRDDVLMRSGTSRTWSRSRPTRPCSRPNRRR